MRKLKQLNKLPIEANFCVIFIYKNNVEYKVPSTFLPSQEFCKVLYSKQTLIFGKSELDKCYVVKVENGIEKELVANYKQ